MAKYRDAIRWIAENDSDGDSDRLDPEAVGYLVSSCLVADVWGKTNEQVGEDVVRERKRRDGGELDAEALEAPASPRWTVMPVQRPDAGGFLYNAVEIATGREHPQTPTHSYEVARQFVERLNRGETNP